MPEDLQSFRQHIISKYPNMNKDQLSQLDSFVNQRQAANLVSSGQLSLDQATNPDIVSLASQITASGGSLPQQPGTQTEAQLKRANVGNLINQLEKSYQPVASPFGAKALAAKILGLQRLGYAPNISRFEADRALTVSPVARVLQQETGQITESDIQRAEQAVPQAIDPPAVALQKIAALRAAYESQSQGQSQVSDPLGILQ